MTNRRAWLTMVLVAIGGIALAQQPDAADQQPDEPAEAGESDAGEESTTVIDELSQAEIDAELARAEEILDDPDEVKEFTDSKPLPADLPLALPSDF